MFTSISPKTTSFSNDIWQIEYVRNLARQIVNIAAVRILNMDPLLRNISDQNNNFSNIVQNISDVKYSCSYLASFDDANICLSKIKKYPSVSNFALGFKMVIGVGNKPNTFFKIKVPNKLKPSPLNLIFKKLRELDEEINSTEIYFELIDFDAY